MSPGALGQHACPLMGTWLACWPFVFVVHKACKHTLGAGPLKSTKDTQMGPAQCGALEGLHQR